MTLRRSNKFQGEKINRALNDSVILICLVLLFCRYAELPRVVRVAQLPSVLGDKKKVSEYFFVFLFAR